MTNKGVYIYRYYSKHSCCAKYTVFQKNGHPFYFFHYSLKLRSIYTKFLSDVAEEMLIQNMWTKYGC